MRQSAAEQILDDHSDVERFGHRRIARVGEKLLAATRRVSGGEHPVSDLMWANERREKRRGIAGKSKVRPVVVRKRE